MTHENKKQEHIRLEEYLAEHFCFRLNEITGSIEFRKKMTMEWEELNEFNIYRQLTENISLDKDSMIALIENFMINLDELATFTRVENSALKSIMSNTFVKERHPYERRAKKLSRRASFIGSTDMPQFLTDPSGSVRWIPFELTGINWNYSKEINIDDVWAQAYTLYKSGFACDVTAEEIKENEAENRQFTMVSAEMELLMKYYTSGSKKHHELFLTTGEIEMNLRKETNGLVKISNNQLGKALRMLGFERDNRYSKEGEASFVCFDEQGNQIEPSLLVLNREEMLKRDVTEHSIGNLVFLHKRDNSEFSAKLPEDKKKVYFNLNRTLYSRNLLHTMSVFAYDTWDCKDAIQTIKNNQDSVLDMIKKGYEEYIS